MGKYSCSVCSENVPPVTRITGGAIVGQTADGLLIERRQCPECGVSLERMLLARWQPAGSLASAQLEPLGAGFE
jgi:hypothetical protein